MLGAAIPSPIVFKHFHLFCGLGSGAAGMNDARAELGPLRAQFRCIGGVDIDTAGLADFERLTGVAGTRLDLFDREQFIAHHGQEPPREWREAGPADIRQAANGEFPNIVFLSSPCKGLSGLLAETLSVSPRYQALNRLTVRGVMLMLEAFKDDPPDLVIFENVPRIATRGRPLLNQIVAVLRAAGYAVEETKHDCGEIGNLAQSRKRFLLVARHMQKVPPFLYQPPKHRLRGVGEVLGKLPLPGDITAGGPMHRVPELAWKTWVRLAFVEAGKDWRSLTRLRVADGVLQDYRLVPEETPHGGHLGVRTWEEPSGVIASRSSPTNGTFSVADPRFDARGEYGQYGVRCWDQTTGTIGGKGIVGGGGYAVADPRHQGPAKHCNEFRVTPWPAPGGAVTSAHGSGQCVADPRGPAGTTYNKYRVTRMDEPAGTVIAASGTGDGAFSVADPRYATDNPGRHHSKFRICGFGEPAHTVTGSAIPANGALSVADPRPGLTREKGSAYASAGHYGVVPWARPAGAVASAACHDNGRCSVADPRALPAPDTRLTALIIAEDGTWHRPFTTLELAALQSLFDVDAYQATGIPFLLEGESDTAHRERIGNAVPRAASRAIAETMGRTLLLARTGESFFLSDVPIWVRPVAIALSLAKGDDSHG